MYRAREFAKLAGVTVRTLHHYDRIGLLKPRRRPGSGYRIYDSRDLERLEQILALKFVGLSLEQIGTLLDRNPMALPQALSLQRKMLEEKRCLIDRMIRAIGEAERELQAEGAPVTVLKK